MPVLVVRIKVTSGRENPVIDSINDVLNELVMEQHIDDDFDKGWEWKREEPIDSTHEDIGDDIEYRAWNYNRTGFR